MSGGLKEFAAIVDEMRRRRSDEEPRKRRADELCSELRSLGYELESTPYRPMSSAELETWRSLYSRGRELAEKMLRGEIEP